MQIIIDFFSLSERYLIWSLITYKLPARLPEVTARSWKVGSVRKYWPLDATMLAGARPFGCRCCWWNMGASSCCLFTGAVLSRRVASSRGGQLVAAECVCPATMLAVRCLGSGYACWQLPIGSSARGWAAIHLAVRLHVDFSSISKKLIACNCRSARFSTVVFSG